MVMNVHFISTLEKAITTSAKNKNKILEEAVIIKTVEKGLRENLFKDDYSWLVVNLTQYKDGF